MADEHNLGCFLALKHCTACILKPEHILPPKQDSKLTIGIGFES